MSADWTLAPDVEQLAAELAAAEDEAARLRVRLARLRRRPVGRGGSRVRELRQALRLTRLMLARQQSARGAGGLKLHLIGGKEHLRERLAELPSVGNPYTSLGTGS